MTSRWLDTRLGDVLTLQRGFDLPAGDRRPGRFPVVASTGVVGTHSEPMVEGPGVVIGRSGSLGGAQYVTGDFWPLNTTLWVKDFKGNDRRFCYYLLKSLNLQTFNVGSGVPTLNRNHVHPLPVRIPVDANEQRAIAHVLGTLDDKIELNRRMNETLEAMARALFKSWFIDFDPVHAKAEGRDPGLPTDIAALFPDSFQDSELGEIPKGWTARKLGELIELAYGKALKGSDRRSGTVAVYGSSGQVGWHDEKLEAGPGIIVGRKGNPGIITWAPSAFYAIDTTFYVVPKPSCPSLYFLFFALQDIDLPSMGADSAVPGLNRNLAYLSAVSLPPLAVLKWFDRSVGIVFDRMNQTQCESHTLTALRDTLLPRLLSGELRTSSMRQRAEVKS